MEYAVGNQQAGRQLRGAPRYEIVAPVRFRSPWGEWVDATTVNIGRLGVLVRTERAVALSARVEMRIDLTQNHTFAGSMVVCWGRVVRTELSDAGETLMAVTIDDFQLQRAMGGDERAGRTDDS